MDPLTMGLMYGGGALLSGLGGMFGAQKTGAASQNAAMMSALAQMQGIQQATNLFNQAKGNLEPYAQAGQSSLGLLQKYLQGNAAQQAGVGGGGPNLISTFAPTQQQLEQTPGYQFILSQGSKAAQNAAAAKGLGSSGNALQSGVDYASNLASTTFQQQLQNYLAQNQQAFNMLFSPSQLGAQAGQSILSGATTLGGNIMQGAAGIGNAMTQGIMGQANAQAQGTNALFGNIGSAMQMPYLMSSMPSPATNLGPKSATNFGTNTWGGIPAFLASVAGYQGPFPSSY